MSSVVVIQNKNIILVSANNTEEEKKIKLIGDKIFVCFGMKKVTDRILDFCESLSLLEASKEDERSKSISRISKICSEVYKQFEQDEEFQRNNNIRILIASLEREMPTLTTLDSSNGFSPDSFYVMSSGFVVTADGIRKEEMLNIVVQNFDNSYSLLDILDMSYNNNSCGDIRGKCEIKGFVNKEFKEYEFDIKEKGNLKSFGEGIYE